MFVLIRYPVGIIVEAVVLATGKNRMRVASAGFPDVIELRRSGSQWFTSTRQPVEFDFVMFGAHQRESTSSSGPALAVGAAVPAAIQ